jgi:hypothetical protein
MKINKILMMAALAGTLATSGAAFADSRNTRASTHADQLDVIGSAQVRNTRGDVTFTITPEMRRDGLQLQTDAYGLQILSVSFQYSDGRIVVQRGRDVAVERSANDSMITIQRGRPPGLRVVRVKYAASSRDRSGRLQLVQIHDGDGYTHEEDLWKYHQDEGHFVTGDEPAQRPATRTIRVRDHRRMR